MNCSDRGLLSEFGLGQDAVVSQLSHLAYIALGVVSRAQPCTSYRLMQEFRTSPSSYFSGSAGAVYPLISRLEKGGYLRSEKRTRGKRAHKTYSLSAKGRKVLTTWIKSPTYERDVSFNVDLLRARVLFLGDKSTSERLKFLNASILLLDQSVAKKEFDLKNETGLDDYDRLALRGALEVDRARRKWLKDIRKELGL